MKVVNICSGECGSKPAMFIEGSKCNCWRYNTFGVS
jgi:hypothetical protein